MYRKLASALIVAGALSVEQALALGLGELTMHSALNEPLDAEIQLKNVGDLDETQIRIGFADQEEFKEAGVEYTSFLSNVKFKVVLDGNEGGVIKVFTTKRVNEPYLDLLMEASWPTGRMLRSYTVLVDLPVYSEPEQSTVDMGEPAKPAAEAEPEITGSDYVESSSVTQVDIGSSEQTAEVAEEAETAYAEPEAEAESEPEVSSFESAAEEKPEVIQEKPAPRRSVVTQSAYEGDTYKIKRNDTLWDIAMKVRPSSEFSVQQTMLAIQRANEHAFINNNINLIKAGEVFRLPSAEMIRELSFRDAVQEVSQQNREWRSAQIDATPSAEAVMPPRTEEEGHLSLTSSGTGSANGKSKTGADVGGLQQDLTSAKENIQALQLDKKDLQKRVNSLNSQVEQLQRLVELKDAELAGLQQEFGKQGKQQSGKPAMVEAPQPEEAPVAEEIAQPAPAAKEQQKPVPAQQPADEKAADEKPQTDKSDLKKPDDQKPEEAAKEAKKPKAQPAPPPAEPGILEKIQENPIYIGVVALVIVLIGVFFGLRRKMQQDKAALAAVENFDFDEMGDDSSYESESGEITEEFDALEEDYSADEESDIDLGIGDSFDTEAEEEEAAPTTMQTGDAIGEADIYIAYGRYEQAAELLLSAVAGSPDDAALRTKLLEVYLESQNKEGFQEQYLELQSRGEVDAVSHAKELLSSADNAADWLDDLPVDAVAPSPAPAAEIADEASSMDDDDDGFDLDLDLDLGGDSEAAELDADFDLGFEEPAQAGESDSEDMMDLDLDLGEEEADDLSMDTEESLDDFSLDTSEPLEDLSLDSEDEVSDDLSLDLGSLDEAPAEDTDFDMGDDLSLDISGEEDLAELSTEESLEMPEEAEDISLDLDEDMSLDLDTDTSMDLDDDLSLDLSGMDETNLDAVKEPEAEEQEDVLDFDGFDLDTSAAEEPEADEEDLGLSLDEDLDISLDTDFEPEAEPEEEVAELELESEAELELEPEAEFEPEVELELEPEPEPEPEPAPVSGDETITRAAIDITSHVEAAAVAPVPAPSEPVESSPLATLQGDDLEFLTDADEVATKLDLSQAYIDMGDIDGARDILMEVMKEGKEDQKAEASALLDSLE